jgi:hypothetical protein
LGARHEVFAANLSGCTPATVTHPELLGSRNHESFPTLGEQDFLPFSCFLPSVCRLLKMMKAASVFVFVVTFLGVCQAQTFINAPAGPETLPSVAISLQDSGSSSSLAGWCQNAFNPINNNYWDPNTPLFIDGAIVIPADLDRPLSPDSSISSSQAGSTFPSLLYCAQYFSNPETFVSDF